MVGAWVKSVDEIPATLLLWDVDHTLIENGGVSKEAYALAFELLTGNAPVVQPTTDGRTDFQIMRELFEANSVEPDRYATGSQIEDALTAALESKAGELAARGHVLSGVVDALGVLSEAPQIVQSVLTGNIAPNARVKLSAFGLEKFFDLDVGGFGSDHEVRSELVEAARRKVAAKYGHGFDERSTVLVGDTPLDVKAAVDGGARIVAVATGAYSAEELARSGADVTLSNLDDLGAFLSALAAVRAGGA